MWRTRFKIKNQIMHTIIISYKKAIIFVYICNSSYNSKVVLFSPILRVWSRGSKDQRKSYTDLSRKMEIVLLEHKVLKNIGLIVVILKHSV